ncbi:MAG: minor capsid protein [Clostridiales bacterium]|nr:minor capsid protein [Clostridiales bacterium]
MVERSAAPAPTRYPILALRTSEICRRLGGQRFPVTEAQAGTNLPPMHPHCRSTTMCDMSRAQLNRVNRPEGAGDRPGHHLCL